jgi:uncharacterized protein YecE (DUF72 family)
MVRNRLHVGCSGWQYRHWRGDFYPADLPVARWLSYYAERFDTVEVNNSFYRLPESATFARWRAEAPPGFVYAVKASRFLTHNKKLKEPGDPLRRFFARARHLGPSLGPVLYQLPPRWSVNLDRLNAFLAALPKRRRHVVEFRDPSWYVDDVFGSLKRRGVALCLHDMEGSATDRIVTGSFAYLRFHGPAKYRGTYTDERLGDWADWCAAQIRQDISVYAYFNNDAGGHAPRDAVRLRRMIEARLQ